MTGRRFTTAHISRTLLTIMLAAGALWLAPLPKPAQAAPAAAPGAKPAAHLAGLLPSPVPTLFVDTTTIADNPNDGNCDLWEALQAVFQANADLSPTYHECTAVVNGPNVIGFTGAAAGGTIEIPNNVGQGDLPFAWGDTTLLGPVTIKPSATNTETHILQMAGNATLTLIAVTLSDGHTSGGGAAILDFNHATVNLYGSNITGNIADEDGGAINSNGNVNVVLSNFSGNESHGMTGTGLGGAIDLTGNGTLSISKSNFAGNTAKGEGGAIYSLSQNATIEDSLFSGNIGGQGNNPANAGGGAVYNDGNGLMAIARTQFAGNLSPQGNGGAVFNTGQAMLITDTTFALNLAGDFSHANLGGAVYDRTSLTIYRSSFANNVSVRGDGGGLVVDRHGSVDVSNSTFALNGAPSGLGGGLVVTQTQQGGPASSLTLRNDTIAKNGTPAQSDAGIFNDAGNNLTLGNTLLDGNFNGNCAGGGSLTNLGHNLDSGTSCNIGGGNGNISSGSAQLGGPSFNGGPLSSMLTMKLNSGSQAIDAGDNAICAAQPVNNEDQRGNKRPVDGLHPGNITPICDIGAYEADGPKPAFAASPSEPGPINVGNVQTFNTVTTNLVVSNTGDFALDLTGLALTGANPGDFSVSLAPIHIDPNTAPVNIVIGCTPLANGQRTALLGFATTDVPLHAAVGYQLKCTGNPAPVAGFGSSPILPGPITFPNTVYVATSSPMTITVSNAGNATLNVNDNGKTGANPGDFIVSGDNFSITPGGAPQPITVQCNPQDYGFRTATLNLTTNDGTQPNVAFNLSCQGVPSPSPYLGIGTSEFNAPSHGVSTKAPKAPADNGLTGAYGLAISPNGKYVYATSYTDGSVSSFLRDASNGSLSFIGQDFAFFSYLAGARLIAMSPDGQNGYAAGQINSDLVQGVPDPVTGEMAFPHGYAPPQLGGAYGVAVSPDGKNVYATGTSGNSVVVFSRNPASGDLTQVQSVISATALSGAHGLTVSPDGQNVYVTGYADPNHGTLAVFTRNAVNGTLTQVQLRFQGDCIDYFFCFFGLDGLKGAFQVAVSPDGANVYVVGTYSGAVLAFSRSGVDGSLHILNGYFNGLFGVSGLSGVSGIDVTPDGLHVIADGYNDHSAVVFDRDPTTGLLTFRQIIQEFAGNPPLNGARDVRVSPDGKTVYVAAYVDNAIAVLPVLNPVPLLTHFSPASATQGGPAFTLHVYGANFVPTTKVFFGASNPPVTYISPYQLDVAIGSALIASAGTPLIQLDTPQPAGGDAFSFPKIFTVFASASPHNPIPSIDHITPPGQLAGGNGLTLDIYGTNFLNGSQVHWNGSGRSTNFVDSGHLQATIPQSDVSQPGASSVTVFTGSPGGGTSNAVSFTVAQPGDNAVPSITSINPLWVFSFGADSKQIQMTITGQNFIQGSTVQLDGANRPTLLVDSSHLQVTIFGSDLAFPNSVAITVFTPSPGGGPSNPLTFTIKRLYRRLLPTIRR